MGSYELITELSNSHHRGCMGPASWFCMAWKKILRFPRNVSLSSPLQEGTKLVEKTLWKVLTKYSLQFFDWIDMKSNKWLRKSMKVIWLQGGGGGCLWWECVVDQGYVRAQPWNTSLWSPAGQRQSWRSAIAWTSEAAAKIPERAMVTWPEPPTRRHNDSWVTLRRTRDECGRALLWGWLRLWSYPQGR
jgi:hypothetical protein